MAETGPPPAARRTLPCRLWREPRAWRGAEAQAQAAVQVGRQPLPLTCARAGFVSAGSRGTAQHRSRLPSWQRRERLSQLPRPSEALSQAPRPSEQLTPRTAAPGAAWLERPGSSRTCWAILSWEQHRGQPGQCSDAAAGWGSCACPSPPPDPCRPKQPSVKLRQASQPQARVPWEKARWGLATRGKGHPRHSLWEEATSAHQQSRFLFLRCRGRKI